MRNMIKIQKNERLPLAFVMAAFTASAVGSFATIAEAQTELATLSSNAATAISGDFTNGITAAASAVLGIIVLMAGITLVFKLVRSVKRS